ncbi:MAG: ester cyclase [Anaerolineales bacterium]
MSTETNKAIVRRYFDQVLNEQQHDLAEEFLAETIELHGTDLAPGLEVVKHWLTMFAAAFPDGHYTVEDVVAEGDRVVARTTFNGTHKAEMQGIPATGKAVSVPSITIFRLDNGKIAEGWLINDNLGMMQQLGVIPATQAS